MRYVIGVGIILLLTGLVLFVGCEDVIRDDFKVYGDVAYVDKRFDDYDSTYILSWQIARHLVAAMKVLQENPDLRALHTVVFTYNGEMEDKYGNKRIDTWTRVSVPVVEWFKYSEEVRHDTHEIRKRVLADWIVEGFPYSAALQKQLVN
ncbi:MAG: hypothetical protein KQJ78_20505 [Deltaproteobacteria bacterium]|nr:hypothetical protein [Deltaproteobacteria bacterium]